MALNQTKVLTVPYTTPGETYAASTVLPFLGIIFVTIRIYSRLLQEAWLAIDDWLMLSALVLVIGMGITLVIGVHGQAVGYPTPLGGNGSLEQELNDVNSIVELMGKIQYAFILLMMPAFGFIKLMILWVVANFVGSVFACGTHFASNWGSIENTVAYCGAENILDSAFVISDLVTDVIVLCLPLPVIWNLHMTTERKLIVSGILATGAVSIVASIIKVVVSYEITNTSYTADIDPDLTISTILYWCMIEGGLAIIAACLPTLRFLVRGVSLDSIINTIRSGLSLASLQSQRTKRSAAPWEDPPTNVHAEGLVTFHAQLVPKTAQRTEFAMGNMETQATGLDNRVM